MNKHDEIRNHMNEIAAEMSDLIEALPSLSGADRDAAEATIIEHWAVHESLALATLEGAAQA